MATLTTASGQHVAYTDHGGDGPPVVFLHGFATDQDLFAPQVAVFSPRYRVITIDERGHGGSLTDADFTYWDIAADAFSVMDELEIEAAVISGTSQGGFIALRMALQAPARVTALAVLGSSAAAEDPDVAESYRAVAEAWNAQGPTDALVDTLATICFNDMAVEEWKTKWRAIDGPRLLRNITTLYTRDGLEDRLGEILAPTLVMHGAADAAYPVAKAEQIVAGLPNAEPLVVVPGGAHFLNYTDSGAVNHRLESFLAEYGSHTSKGRHRPSPG